MAYDTTCYIVRHIWSSKNAIHFHRMVTSIRFLTHYCFFLPSFCQKTFLYYTTGSSMHCRVPFSLGSGVMCVIVPPISCTWYCFLCVWALYIYKYFQQNACIILSILFIHTIHGNVRYKKVIYSPSSFFTSTPAIARRCVSY